MERVTGLGRLLVAALVLALAGCSGDDGAAGAAGPAGPAGQDGSDGSDGTNGTNGTDGVDGGNVGVAELHGTAFVIAEDEKQGAPANPKYLANIAITGATADAAGVATVTFTVKAKDDKTPVTGLRTVSAGIFKLQPKGNGLSYNRWVPYIYRPGRTVNAGYRESTSTGGTLVENGAGSYTYTFGKNLATAAYAFPIGGESLVGYDRSRTHLVSIYIGGHSGPTGEADFTFVPDGVSALQTRDIVQTEACKKCHGVEFHGHGGDRVTVLGCNSCHSPFSAMVNDEEDGGTTESIEMAVMIHRMHAGRELASAPGADGVFFDDPTTVGDESADNGTYTLGSLDASWRSAAFPAGIQNCEVCHTGSGADVDNWKNVPSRAACGSCHDTIDWTTGTNHAFGAATSDDSCVGCHSPTGRIGAVQAHEFSVKDIRKVPEFDVALTISTPANGTHFVAGEAPVVTVVLTDATTGLPLDHTTVIEDATAEGCTPNDTGTACLEERDGQFRNANMYVTGPRAKRIPALTRVARAAVGSATAEPFDLSAGGELRVKVDGGNFIKKFGHVGADSEDVLIPGDFTVTLPAASTAFANPAAATAVEVAAWLNDHAEFEYNERAFSFTERARAYADNGIVSIRTRGFGTDNPTIQIPDATKGLGLFADTGIKFAAGGAVQLRQRTNPANADTAFSATAGALTYTLDPVDDVAPGTYMVNVEFADRGRTGQLPDCKGSESWVCTMYRTPSVAVATFQVGQAEVEKPIAGNCTSCHWSTDAVGEGAGFVLDPVRHNKPFDAQALDQCGGCHDYASGETVDRLTWTTGGGSGKPISKRVHAVHNGASLEYPVITIDHEEGTIGRGWKIHYPMDVRNCDSCHSKVVDGEETMSGTWTKPGRLACMGCHDSDGAAAHMKLQVYDPTPTAPWSGDEEEACAACH